MVLVHPFRDVRTSAYLFVLAFLHTCKMATPILGINIRKKMWLVPLVMILISRKLKSFQQMSVTSVQPLSLVRLFATPWIAAYQASLSITNSWNLPKPMSIKSVTAPTISSSVIPFSSCPQSLPASGSFQMSQLFSWGGQSTGVSASTSVLPVNNQDWSPLGWTDWISADVPLIFIIQIDHRQGR